MLWFKVITVKPTTIKLNNEKKLTLAISSQTFYVTVQSTQFHFTNKRVTKSVYIYIYIYILQISIWLADIDMSTEIKILNDTVYCVATL
jgi:hypothetical protein